MPVPFTALALTASLFVTVADNVPKLDVTASCRGAAANADPSVANTTREQCVVSEGKAHDQLVEEWSQFTPADRAKCVSAVTGFEPTYSELITCLEMARDVRNPPRPAASNVQGG
jgi:hypothetical protein